MALVVFDRVQETTATTGTGTLTLTGAVPGYQSFAVVGTGNTTYYCIINNTDWEVGIGTYTASGTTLSRDTILSNSLGTTSPLNLSGGSAVFVTYPAEKSINYDANGVATIGSTLGYSDTGIIASFASTEPTYNQVVVQNKSTANTASANFNVSNDAATGTDNYAEFGINSSTFVGDSSFDLPGAAYISSATTPLTIGTYAAEPIHFITNGDSTTTDAMTIYDDGSVTLGGLPASGIGNISCNNINLKFQQVTTSGGTTTLTNASPYYTQFTGTSAQDLVLPDATTCLEGTTFVFDNDSTQTVTIKDGSGTSFEILVPGGFHTFILEDNSTVAGTWLRYSQVPSTVEWGTYSLQLGSTVISGGTWQGGTVQVGYGGTGLTSLTSGGALYATSSSTMTSGTLPVTAGGTGQTSFSSGYIPYGNSSAALQSSSLLQFNGSYLQVGGGSVLGGTTNPIAAFTQTANGYVQTYIYNASSGGSGSSDFVAYTDNSTDAHGWADIGYTSSTYNDASYSVTGPNEAYILGSAPANASATGNLVYATDSTGSANAHQWYVGGFNQAKNAWKMQLTSTGLELANNPTFSGGTANGVLYLNGSKVATSGSSFVFDGTNVGIGTSSPATKLNIYTASATGTYLRSENTAGFLYTGVKSSGVGYVATESNTALELGTNGTVRATFDTSGNLGLGVTPSAWNSALKAMEIGSVGTSVISTPASGNLTLAANAYYNASAAWIYGQSQYAARYAIRSADGQHQWFTAPSGTAGDPITFTQAMTLDASGNLGIGTSSPGAKLHVVGDLLVNSQVIQNTAGTSTISYTFGGQTTKTGMGCPADGTLAFYAGTTTERMRIDSSGNVGIGVTSPSTYTSSTAGSLIANGDISVLSNVTYPANNYPRMAAIGGIGGVLGAYQWAFYTGGSSSVAPSERMRISSTGGLSVGTTADPGAGAIYATGNITAYYSDDRLKTKLGGIENALDKVKSLSGFYYEANKTAQDLGYKAVREVGVSAQQVQAVLPEIVKPAPIDQQYLTVDYERLVPLLIEAIKELEEKVAKLEAK